MDTKPEQPAPPAPQALDVTGLSPEAIRTLESLVVMLRRGTGMAFTPSGPPPGETAEQWVARFRAWVASHPKRDIVIDDSRETIYAGRGESQSVPGVRSPNQTDPEAWSAAFRRWADSHPKRDIVIDDSRETIYADRGE